MGRRCSTSGAYRGPNLSVTVRAPPMPYAKTHPYPPSFNARHFSEDCQRGVKDSLISHLRKSGTLGKAHTLANRIDGQRRFRIRDDLELAKQLGHGHALPLQAADHHALYVPHEPQVLL
ncbi:hypothetical protein K523DRAFT_381686 [Schizophyllum commune Tattone D]|nr:hypothetical protein K523DRAFT_381686 [Schizophyllum commune Tattone D]